MAEAARDTSEGVESRPKLDDVREWVGAKLDEMGGASIGRVEGLLVDALGGQPTWIIARLGRFGRRCGIPVEFVAAGSGHVWVPFGRDLIKAATEVDPVGGLSCGDERILAGRFGIPAAAGRLAEIEGRDDGDPGSVPL